MQYFITACSIHMRAGGTWRLCNNQSRNGSGDSDAMLEVRMTQWKRILLWLVLLALATAVTYFGVRGYLSPELLLGFSSGFTC